MIKRYVKLLLLIATATSVYILGNEQMIAATVLAFLVSTGLIVSIVEDLK